MYRKALRTTSPLRGIAHLEAQKETPHKRKKSWLVKKDTKQRADSASVAKESEEEIGLMIFRKEKAGLWTMVDYGAIVHQ